jgi:hypothetical protein
MDNSTAAGSAQALTSIEKAEAKPPSSSTAKLHPDDCPARILR